MHLHLEPVGGISGDMFIGAILSCRPELESDIPDVLLKVGLADRVSTSFENHRDHTLSGSRFVVNQNSHDHHHTSFQDIRDRLEKSTLAPAVINRAIDIFERLAIAEGKCHGCPPEDVTFHEVGALDSIADITIAAYLIEALGADSWSVSAIPLGSGRINSQHGLLPVPAPATTILLQGLTVFDDGISGERVTPTGAAIINHLNPSYGVPTAPAKFLRSGIGFGTRTFKGLSNILRISELQPYTTDQESNTEQITIINFEVDDQTPEDLAAGIDCLRHSYGVIDVNHSTVIGKKGRHAMHVQVLCHSIDENVVMDECFLQTSTIGIRFHHVQRRILTRTESLHNGVRVKTANRLESMTAKADIDDVTRKHTTHVARVSARLQAEEAILNRDKS